MFSSTCPPTKFQCGSVVTFIRVIVAVLVPMLIGAYRNPDGFWQRQERGRLRPQHQEQQAQQQSVLWWRWLQAKVAAAGSTAELMLLTTLGVGLPGPFKVLMIAYLVVGCWLLSSIGGCRSYG